MMVMRFFYLAYDIKQLNWEQLSRFLTFAEEQTGKSRLRLWLGLLRDALVYNISVLECFQFGFYKGLPAEEKRRWAGTGYMYRYQRLMNPPRKRSILDDKRLFYKYYRQFFKHRVYTLKDMEGDLLYAYKALQQPKVVLKTSNGKCGRGTVFFESANFTPVSLRDYMRREGYTFAETFAAQHPDLQRLSPSGVNTVRIFTQLNAEGGVDILGCRQRISVNSTIDNMVAGNLAAPIDEVTGLINGPGVYSDITKAPVSVHPITGVPIVGFQVPFWEDCLRLATDAALAHPQNRSVGWDLVVTPDGVGLQSAHALCCPLLWQLPVGKGLKHLIANYRS
jgi:hypothetical protein